MPDAGRIVGLAFATFLGAEQPETFMEGREFLASRLAAYPDGGFAALRDRQLIGSNMLANWGSFGFFGPLTVHPAHWGAGVGKRLMERTVERFDEWKIKHAALYTFADSAKHHRLYQRFDFWPRFLTVLMTKSLSDVAGSSRSFTAFRRFSELEERPRAECLAAARELCEALLEGLDVSAEIRIVARAALGESLWLWSDAGLEAFAVCQYGAGSEAAPAACYVKFAAVRPGPEAERWFGKLLRACETLALQVQLSSIDAGMNLERRQAYRAMLRGGFKVNMYGVQMFRGNDPAYNREEVYIIDDLR